MAVHGPSWMYWFFPDTVFLDETSEINGDHGDRWIDSQKGGLQMSRELGVFHSQYQTSHHNFHSPENRIYNRQLGSDLYYVEEIPIFGPWTNTEVGEGNARPWQEVNEAVSARMRAASSDSPPLIPDRDYESGPMRPPRRVESSEDDSDGNRVDENNGAMVLYRGPSDNEGPGMPFRGGPPPFFPHPDFMGGPRTPFPPPGMGGEGPPGMMPHMPEGGFPPPPPMFMPPGMMPPPPPPPGYFDDDAILKRKKGKKQKNKRRAKSMEHLPPPPPLFFPPPPGVMPPMGFPPMGPPPGHPHGPPPGMPIVSETTSTINPNDEDEGNKQLALVPSNPMGPPGFDGGPPPWAGAMMPPPPFMGPGPVFFPPQPMGNGIPPPMMPPSFYATMKGDDGPPKKDGPGPILKDVPKKENRSTCYLICCKGHTQVLWIIIGIILVGVVLGLVLGLTLV